MRNELQRVREEILLCVSGASDHRLRPHEVERSLSHRLGVSIQTVRQGVKDLVEEGKLAYTYRDPTSYIEMAEGLEPLPPAY